MSDTTSHSDLIDHVHHEHNHLRLLFEDLHQRFEHLATGDTDGEPSDELVEAAADDLATALEEMLHHFNQEEEVFFVDIEARFPEFAADVASLVQGHEMMGERTRWLQKQFNRGPAAIVGNIEEVLEAISQMHALVLEHTAEEQRLFDQVLKRIPPHERVSLLREMQSI